jgi:hypothetical protein
MFPSSGDNVHCKPWPSTFVIILNESGLNRQDYHCGWNCQHNEPCKHGEYMTVWIKWNI